MFHLFNQGDIQQGIEKFEIFRSGGATIPPPDDHDLCLRPFPWSGGASSQTQSPERTGQF